MFQISIMDINLLSLSQDTLNKLDTANARENAHPACPHHHSSLCMYLILIFVLILSCIIYMQCQVTFRPGNLHLELKIQVQLQ